MTPFTFLKVTKKDIVTRVAERAGTTYGWFRQLAHGHGAPSPKMAVALEEASRYYAVSDCDIMTAEEILELDALRNKRAREVEKKVDVA